jgi:hypothetical protein
MPSLFPSAVILGTLAALGSIEGLAWWWMNPPPAGHDQPVLAYRPTIGLDRRPARQSLGGDGAGPLVANGVEGQGAEIGDRGSEIVDSPTSSADPQSTIHNPQSSISPSSPNLQSPITNLSSFTPLPDIYRQAAPMLRCSTGEVFRIDTPDSLTLHLAWFEWNRTDTGSVLEAFRHMPEACMGSIGLKLVAKEKPIPYTVGLAVGLDLRAGPLVANGAKSEIGGQRSEVSGQGAVASPAPSTKHKEPVTSRSSTDNGPRTTDNSSSSPTDNRPQTTDSASSSSISASQRFSVSASTQSLLFDHTVFEDPSAAPGLKPRIHSFRAVWVSGMHDADARRGISGRELDQLRTIRLNAAATRYRPTHARVIQGTVRGALNAEAAWHAFEHHMLRHLTFER